ncbi:MAG: family 20 glycosylhydrolase, partial [Flavobacteriaceae bacterium]
SLVPKPNSIKLGNGGFALDGDTRFVVDKADTMVTTHVLSERFQSAFGSTFKVVSKAPEHNYIRWRVDTHRPDEGYTLNIGADSIIISAKDAPGFIHAQQTILQLLPNDIWSNTTSTSEDWVLPAIFIEDAPRFQWRGLMLDVSRHFFGIAYIKKTLDRMAMLKLNTFHWHLIDDQGWRIEIKKYPKLTEIGGFRVDQEDRHWNDRNPNDPGEKGTYGGYYTQEEIKEVVAYASRLGITVVPEIEMPAHVTSGMAAYPELTCFGQPVAVPSGGIWPITDIYCAGKESTFAFLEDVLDEVMDIFPSEYIHVGGDEATRTNWEKCPDCQRRINEEGLADEGELQSYFIKRVEQYLRSKGRKLIGWDEILEGGLAPGAAVMSWRGAKGGIEASEQGHPVVMTPGEHCYLNHYQGPQEGEPLAQGGFTPITKVYDFDPVVEGMSPEQAKWVLGGQANLWSEYITTEAHSEYMLFPRLLAMAETLWTSKEQKDWPGFAQRMEAFFPKLETMGINYAKSAYTIRSKAEVDDEKNTVSVSLYNEVPQSTITYVLNDGDLHSDGVVYEGPIALEKTTRIKAGIVEAGAVKGNIFEETYTYHKAVGKPITFTHDMYGKYQGAGPQSLVNVVRGSANFHDGQWQAWLGKDMIATIDLGTPMEVSKVTVGAMENQPPGIFYPTRVQVEISLDGTHFNVVGFTERPFAPSAKAQLTNFGIDFERAQARYLRVTATNLGKAPNGSGSFLFIDEILVE